MLASAPVRTATPSACLGAVTSGCNCKVRLCALRVIRGGQNSVALSRKEEECCNRATD